MSVKRATASAFLELPAVQPRNQVTDKQRVCDALGIEASKFKELSPDVKLMCKLHMIAEDREPNPKGDCVSSKSESHNIPIAPMRGAQPGNIVFVLEDINRKTIPPIADIVSIAAGFDAIGLRSLAAHLLAAAAISHAYSWEDRIQCMQKCAHVMGGTVTLDPPVATAVAIEARVALDFMDASSFDAVALSTLWKDCKPTPPGAAQTRDYDAGWKFRRGEEEEAWNGSFQKTWQKVLGGLDSGKIKQDRRRTAARHLVKLASDLRRPGVRRCIASTFDKHPFESKRVLKQAILANNLDVVKFLVENARLPRGFLDNSDTGHKRARHSLLSYAARLPSTDIAKYLLSKGFTASKIAKGSNPLTEAVKAGNKAMVDLLVNRGCPITATVVKAACRLPVHADAQWLIETITPEAFDALAPDVQLDLFELALKSDLDNAKFIGDVLGRHRDCLDFFAQRVNKLDPWLRSFYAWGASITNARATFRVLVPDEEALKDVIVQQCLSIPGADWPVSSLIGSAAVRERFSNVDAICREIANDPKSHEARPQGQDTVAATLGAVFKLTPWVLDPNLITAPPTPANSTASAHHNPLDRPIVPQHDQ